MYIEDSRNASGDHEDLNQSYLLHSLAGEMFSQMGGTVFLLAETPMSLFVVPYL